MTHFHLIDSTSSWPAPFDPEAAEIGRQDWLEAAAPLPCADTAKEIAANPSAGALMACIFGNSPFLSVSAIRDPEFVCRLMIDGPDETVRRILIDLSEKRKESLNENTLSRVLRIAKRQIALAVALADISGKWPLSKVTETLSKFAALSLSVASAHLLRESAAQGAFTLKDEVDPENQSGLIILGMGKLGAFELNYSSDIDLIVLFDDECIETTTPDKLQNHFIRIARGLVRILQERTIDGYVFRTDLRLRPDPSATPLALSVLAAETYYESLGQNWERAAMIKARPVAGGTDAGAAFLRHLTPFVWRKNLDFAAIQDIHSIKRQINAHKGGGINPDKAKLLGRNIKLGPGGIREIEFYAQTQQLIWGGREPSLRTPQTIQALTDLADFGQCASSAANELIASYTFLRRLEHRLQMINDEQTQTLPDNENEFSRIATFMGFPSAEAFSDELLLHLNRTHAHYAALFADAPDLSAEGAGNLVFTGADTDPDTLETIAALGFKQPDMVDATVRGWHHGRYRAVRSTRAREILTEILPRLLTSVGDTPDPDATFIKFDEFLQGLPTGVQLFAMIQANPHLLDLLAEIIGAAPRLARHLSSRPAVLDSVLAPDFFEALPDRDTLESELTRLLERAEYAEDVLDLCRRWAHDRRFQAGVHHLQGLVSADAASRALSDIAETAVKCLYGPISAEFEGRHGKVPGSAMAVLALGKLGSREMTANSDLDLVFIYDVPSDAAESDGEKPLSITQYFARLSQRLINALTALTSEGGLYEVDMRLRPSGNSGPIATTLGSFIKYQNEDAWTWEHMALTRSRIIMSTSTVLAKAIDAAIKSTLTGPRTNENVLRDVASMRHRLVTAKPADGPWSLKQVRGGTVDIEFIAQYLMLRHAAAHPEILDHNTVTQLTNLQHAGLLDTDIAEQLGDALHLWHGLLGMLGLTVEGDGFEFSDTLKSRLALLGDCDVFDELEAKMSKAASGVYEIFRDLIESPATDLPDNAGNDEDMPLPPV